MIFVFCSCCSPAQDQLLYWVIYYICLIWHVFLGILFRIYYVYPHLQITDQHAEKQNKPDIVIIHKGLKTRVAFTIGHQPLLIDK